MTSPPFPGAPFGPRPSATALGDMGLAALTQVPHRNAAVAGSFTTGIMYLRDAIMGGDHRPAIVGTFVDSLQRLRDIPPEWAMEGALSRALATGYVLPFLAMQPVIAVLKADPVFEHTMGLAARGDTAGIVALLDQGLIKVLSQPLLLGLMRSTIVSGPELEFILTAVRGWFLGLAAKGVEGDAGFAEALAAQCFLNEYAFFQSEDELRQVNALAGRDGPPSPFVTAVLASYRPLSSYPWAARLPASALVTQQVTEPAAEQGLAASIETLKPISDATSQVVRALYEENPYPRWVTPYRTAVWATRDLYRMRYPNADFRHLDTVAVPEILVAGCGTGFNLLVSIGGYEAWRVTAIDLSRASLAHAQRHLTALGIQDIRLLQADILDLPAALPQMFDIVEAAGVLHHMADPMAGWRALAGKLRPGGMMQIALYSKTARRGIDKVRAFAKERYQPTAEGIRAFRRDALAILREPAHPLRPAMEKAGISASHDFFATSTCRDLFFHPQETAYTIPELKRMIADLGLVFRGFSFPSPAFLNAYRQRFPNDPQGLNLDHWHGFEQENPSLFIRMYTFVVQKPL